VAWFCAASGGPPGQWWDVGASYGEGPWRVGLSYWNISADNPDFVGDDLQVDGFSVAGSYSVAPGLDLAADIDFIDAENVDQSTLDTDGTVFVLSTIFSF
jgi:hypothetical protein